MKFFLLIFGTLLFFTSCKNSKYSLDSNLYKNSFKGVLVIDPIKKDTLYNHNSTKYFTPASNTKIFTLYSSLHILPNKIPALKYSIQKDTLYIQGTGDPTLLHPYFKDSIAISFLKKHSNIALNTSNFKDNKYGPGWAWEDYDTYYSPEKNGLPIYGNVLTIHKGNNLIATPNYFKDSITFSNLPKRREEHTNMFYYNSASTDTITTPFITNNNVIKDLLEDILQKNITISSRLPEGDKNILYSVASDSVYKRMMHKSDNFLAEQLMLVSSGVLTDTLKFKIAKEYILETKLSNLKQKPRWVDGSGLSRYNLFTPESMVYVLHELYKNLPKERLYTLFPVVNAPKIKKEDTMQKPYLYAKSGSLGNNYCLSGYLITNSGKTVIFSFMNNHFVRSSSDIKKEMHQFFEHIRDTY
ncbi:D-alanyl-D-alanine carboxypeptidase/D-alanyl-D-alanine-endopeptidase (penicillin-binding protein 4) [Maribacter vaceletii]|uniref:D-alanyl-D-alanine carboxypeptidase/D-alanyl-D-alanine-endopeptidase (Penicillin-binding protein 4) n=1 Tax=Maribacter vaceletii TaxID=1206816 RepID=A0A495DTE5_9FLAO|nr:D-alanyl-D-alanine carboxypeptidase [Maribacter vaceletii]RKR07912.1 D-alanyl-D-alanine carboxypeptidase/D-alanyl-D-alanine-endopeptidase (penicillin-binding protein 4) [Maribacter vaceletii]